jgi:hypothetical protein
MSQTRVEPATGTIDGANVLYSTPSAYGAGTLRVLLNGQLLPPDCLTELDPSAGTWRWEDAQPPRAGDTVANIYTDGSGVGAGDSGEAVFIRALKGRLRPLVSMQGVLRPLVQVKGAMRAQIRLSGAIKPVVGITGSITPIKRLRGRMRCIDA